MNINTIKLKQNMTTELNTLVFHRPDRDTLVSFIRTCGLPLPLCLKHIEKGKAHFTLEIKYPLEHDCCACYTVVADIPLSDPLFYDDDKISRVYPDISRDDITFVFDGIVDNQGNIIN